MSLGEMLLRELCDILGNGVYVLLREIINRVLKEGVDEELALYGLAYMYGLPYVEKDGKLRLKRKVHCIDVAKLANVEHDEDYVYIRKPSPDEADKSLKATIKAISSVLREFLGQAARILLKRLGKALAESFRGPNEAAIRISSELARNPYSPKLTVEVEGRKIIVYSQYPFEVDPKFIKGTVVPIALAYAAAMMNGYEELKLKDAYISDKNTIVLVFEAERSALSRRRFSARPLLWPRCRVT